MPANPPVPPGLRAGLRASDYGIRPFPGPVWWTDSIRSMASRFPASRPVLMAVVVEIDGKLGPGCQAHFPNPDGGDYPGVRFDEIDEFEPAFKACSEAGIRLWLQVEPAGCDMGMLIDLVMKTYAHHPGIIGFGVDDEWYQAHLHKDGKPVTDDEARAWVKKVRSHNPAYLTFVKHWVPERMPPNYRDGLVFINDSQEFASLEAMQTEFEAWGKHFAPSPVGLQFGYLSDRQLWSPLKDPPSAIGSAILERVPNASDLIWVDFSARSLGP